MTMIGCKWATSGCKIGNLAVFGGLQPRTGLGLRLIGQLQDFGFDILAPAGKIMVVAGMMVIYPPLQELWSL